MQGYPPPPGFHMHDGFFFRAALGIGSFSSKGSYSDSLTGDGSYTVKGGAVAFELAVGGAVSPGFILAASLAVTGTDKATEHEDGYQDVTIPASLSSLGLLFDYYPRPSQGLHFGGLLGLSGVSYQNDSSSRDDSRSGFAIGGHVGYEWWVGSDWALGLMGRITFAYARRDVDLSSGPITETYRVKDSVVSPALLFTVTYN